MITCREVIEFLMSYLDGELPEASRASFEAHLKRCPACQRYLATYQETVRLGKSAFVGEEAQGAPEELVRAILEAKRRAAAGGAGGAGTRFSPPSGG